MELMVAMAITTIIVTVLVSITSIALDTWNRSRAELRASRQAKAMIDTMAKDLEAMVIGRHSNSEWASFRVPSTLAGPNGFKSSNAAEMDFMTAATDRYDGELGTSKDLGGDVSCVAYRLVFNNPLDTSAGSDDGNFILYRKLVDPKETFEDILGNQDLRAAFESKYNTNEVTQGENFLCENIFQFTITAMVEVTVNTNQRVLVPVRLDTNGTDGNQVEEFTVLGTGIRVDSNSSFSYGSRGISKEELEAGKLRSIGISVTVLSDFGMNQVRRRTFTDSQMAEFLAKNSFMYSKVVQVPTN